MANSAGVAVVDEAAVDGVAEAAAEQGAERSSAAEPEPQGSGGSSGQAAPKASGGRKKAASKKKSSSSTAGTTAAAPKKGSAVKPQKKSVTASASSAGPSIRERVFKLLLQHPDGLQGSEIQAKLKLGGIPSLLKDEGCCEKPRLKRLVSEGSRAVLYALTGLGRSNTESGKVDSNAAPSAKGKPWPTGR